MIFEVWEIELAASNEVSGTRRGSSADLAGVNSVATLAWAKAMT